MSAPPITAPGVAMRLPVSLEGGLRSPDFNRPIGDTSFIQDPAPTVAAQRTGKPSAFETLFMEAVGETNNKLNAAETAATEFASGKSDDIHGTMIAVSQADIQLRLVGSMRNRIVEAFNEVWRMQV